MINGYTEWNNGTYYIKAKKGRIAEGDVFNRDTGKTWSLRDFANIERDAEFFPADVSQNFHRIMNELGINVYRDL